MWYPNNSTAILNIHRVNIKNLPNLVSKIARYNFCLGDKNKEDRLTSRNPPL